MKYDLFSISDIIQKYALIISKIANVDVEVVDRKLYRVAGTGIYEMLLNEDMSSKGYVYTHVLKSGKTQIVHNPGEDELCLLCPDKDNCIESFEISTPIKLKDEVVGVIGLITTNKDTRKLLEDNLGDYLDLLNTISDFISVKLFESYEDLRKLNTINALNLLIDNIDQGVIILNNSYRIVSINEIAKKQLMMKKDLVGNVIKIVETGDTLNNNKEYEIEIDNEKFTIIGEVKDLNNNENLSKIIIFSNIKDYHSSIYSFTAMQNTGEIIGVSESTLKLKREIRKIANSISTVLITGESGTGKEIVATSIWKKSYRKNKRFVAINCAAIPETLLESELFGYVKGSFTGADANGRIGKFELANNGILFLDEIGDMPLFLQTKLLRVIEDKKITRIGSNNVIPLNIRIIAATNKDLKKMINENKFREDLYYRLNVIPIQIAPLRERKEDINELAKFFIMRYTELFNKRFVRIEDSTMSRLISYPWYGNVRELENIIEFMINMMEVDGILDDNTLPREILDQRYQQKSIKSDDKINRLEDLEMNEIRKAIIKYGNSTEGKQRISEELGIGIATLYRKLSKYSLN